MIGIILKKELLTYFRSGIFITLAIAIIALIIAADTLSTQRISAFERERTAAEFVDKDVWVNQGERNPHAAAHFARYAFKPLTEFAAFDPGITDHSGMALWMEAHNQNPAVFRRIEDMGEAARLAELSPAWILQYIAPLFIFLILFGAVAGEREAGTLRQMATSGTGSRLVVVGKLLGAILVFSLILTPAVLISIFFNQTHGSAPILSDSSSRFAGLLILYSGFILTIGALAIGVSALFKEKRNALILLVGVWALSFMMLPRLGSSLATTIYPQPDSVTISQELSKAASAAVSDKTYQAKIQQEVLAAYDVSTVKDLPINYVGYSLQKAEEYAYPLFGEIYSGLDATYQGQERVLDWVSFMSPVIAMKKLSSGLSGTDRIHQKAFTSAVEQHRRETVQLLNGDYMRKGISSRRYTANEELWQQVKDFSYTPPRFFSNIQSYTLSIILLMFYFLGSFGFAFWAVKRAYERLAA